MFKERSTGDANLEDGLSGLHRAFVSRFPQKKHSKLIVISDIHYPRNDSRTDMLCEFLTYHTCDTLVILGDKEEGYEQELQALRSQDVRFLNLLNHMRAQGTRIYDIPGNHDAFKRSKQILGRRIFGTEYAYDMALNDDGHHIRFLHGDHIGGDFERRYGRFLFKFAKSIPVSKKKSLVDVYERANFLGLSIVEKRKPGKKQKLSQQQMKTKRGKNKFYRNLGHVLLNEGFDAAICGHIHMPQEFRQISFGKHGEKQSYLYANSGGWVDKMGTALTYDEQGRWELIDWAADRKTYPAFSCDDAHAQYTERSLAEYEWLKAAHMNFGAKHLLRDQRRAIDEVTKTLRKLMVAFSRLEEMKKNSAETMQRLAPYADIEVIDSAYAQSAENAQPRELVL